MGMPHALTGVPAGADDLQHVQTIYDEELATLPGAQTLRSTPVMKRVGEDRPSPL
jgi:hypothetical protein